MSADERTGRGEGDPGNGPDSSLSDMPLLDLLDSLVSDRGRVAAAEALGMNYRTLVNCYDSRRVSRRMRQVLVEFRDAGGPDEVRGDVDAVAQVGNDDGDDEPDHEGEPLAEQVAALEDETRQLRELVEHQGRHLEELGRRVAGLEGQDQQPTEAGAVGGDDQQREWRPPRRGHALPGAGVVTLEEQPNEEHAFGPAAPMVAEWREVRNRGQAAGSRVDQAVAAVRRWELERRCSANST